MEPENNGITKVLRESNYQFTILYPPRIYFENEDKMETFSEKQLRELLASRSALKYTGKGVI